MEAARCSVVRQVLGVPADEFDAVVQQLLVEGATLGQALDRLVLEWPAT